MTLAGTGGDDDEWFFQIPSTLTTGSSTGAVVILTNGAQACNVWWQVGSSATIGTETVFSGNIIARAAVSVLTRASIEGVVFALDEAVTFDDNFVNGDVCRIGATTTAAVPTSTEDPATVVTTPGGGGDGTTTADQPDTTAAQTGPVTDGQGGTSADGGNGGTTAPAPTTAAPAPTGGVTDGGSAVPGPPPTQGGTDSQRLVFM